MSLEDIPAGTRPISDMAQTISRLAGKVKRNQADPNEVRRLESLLEFQESFNADSELKETKQGEI